MTSPKEDWTVGNQPAVPAYAGAADDDATIIPWRGDNRGVGSQPAAVVRVSGAWRDAVPPARPPDASTISTQQPPADIDATGVRSPQQAPAAPQAPVARPLQEGDVLDGRYTLVKE